MGAAFVAAAAVGAVERLVQTTPRIRSLFEPLAAATAATVATLLLLMLEGGSVAFEAAVETGDESNPRLEFYFDHARGRGKVLVMAWGDRLARVTLGE